jgi:hypothetical protein
MINPLSLHAHNRLVRTPFGLLGTDENALSSALKYTFQQCLPLLQWFLKHIGISGIHQSSLQKARIDLQRHRSGDSDQGITDIEIHLPGHFHVIIEAKVGLAVPTIEQCCKYLPRFLETNERCQKLVTLVQSPDNSFVTDYAHVSIGQNFSQSVSVSCWATLSGLNRRNGYVPFILFWIRSIG